jgi:preprotein translocase subunit YajC
MIPLQANAAQQIFSFLPLIGIVLVFYLFFMRPQQKKQKAQTRFLSDLQKGDKVATSAGIIGKINKIENDIVTLQVDSKTFIQVLKGVISKEMTDSLGGK